jgi:4-hydroxybenzoate polyprenyltransferase
VSLRDGVHLLRPWQWSKNGILFAGLVFSVHLLDPAFALRALGGFVSFCVASSAIYVLNDLCDVERDRLHPAKRNRPIASGRVRPRSAIVLFTVLFFASAALGLELGTSFLGALGLFYLINVSYSFWLKHVVILDVLLIAISFVIRAIGGVMALRPLDPAIEISPWLLLCTLFLALFLGLGKRRHELALLDSDASGHRATLREYSREFLDQLITVVTAGTLLAYAIYTIAPGTVSKFHTPALVYTIPFVVYGVFRYLYLIREREQGGNPSRTFYRDLPILLTTLGWLVTVVVVIYAGRL